MLALGVVPNIRAPNPKDNVFSDVCCVVGHTLKVSGHDERIQ
jgi:hypothetical protein